MQLGFGLQVCSVVCRLLHLAHHLDLCVSETCVFVKIGFVIQANESSLEFKMTIRLSNLNTRPANYFQNATVVDRQSLLQ